jgi:hypothetical protein
MVVWSTTTRFFALTNLWVTDGSPADNAGRADAVCCPVVLNRRRAIFRIVDFYHDH